MTFSSEILNMIFLLHINQLRLGEGRAGGKRKFVPASRFQLWPFQFRLRLLPVHIDRPTDSFRRLQSEIFHPTPNLEGGGNIPQRHALPRERAVPGWLPPDPAGRRRPWKCPGRAAPTAGDDKSRRHVDILRSTFARAPRAPLNLPSRSLPKN